MDSHFYCFCWQANKQTKVVVKSKRLKSAQTTIFPQKIENGSLHLQFHQIYFAKLKLIANVHWIANAMFNIHTSHCYNVASNWRIGNCHRLILVLKSSLTLWSLDMTTPTPEIWDGTKLSNLGMPQHTNLAVFFSKNIQKAGTPPPPLNIW